MSNYRLVRPDNNNGFYKVLAAISTVGIVAITGIQVSTALKKANTTEDQMAKIMVEIKNARKDALAEVKTVRADVLKELNALKTQTVTELKSDSASALGKVETAQKIVLAEVKTIKAELLKEIKGFECIEGE